MKATRRLALTAVVTLAVAGCTSAEEPVNSFSREWASPVVEEGPDATPEASPEAQAAEGEPQRIGDDPVLDGLAEECQDGVTSSCATLLWESPVGSEYEELSQDRLFNLTVVAVPGSAAGDLVEQLGPIIEDSIEASPDICQDYLQQPEKVMGILTSETVTLLEGVSGEAVDETLVRATYEAEFVAVCSGLWDLA